jgi:hypothetical protein
MKRQRLVPSCSETLTPLYERARREGRVASPEDAPALLRSVAAAWRDEQAASTPPDLEDVKAVIHDYCITAGVIQLSAWAEEIDGHIDVRILERKKAG